MVIKLKAAPGASQPPFHWIEQLLPRFFKRRRVPVSHYFLAEELCDAISWSFEEIYNYVLSSKEVYGVLLTNGQFLVHPDGGKKLILNYRVKPLLAAGSDIF